MYLAWVGNFPICILWILDIWTWSSYPNPLCILFKSVILCKSFQSATTTLCEVHFHFKYYFKGLFNANVFRSQRPHSWEVNFNCEFYDKGLFDVKVFRAQKPHSNRYHKFPQTRVLSIMY